MFSSCRFCRHARRGGALDSWSGLAATLVFFSAARLSLPRRHGRVLGNRPPPSHASDQAARRDAARRLVDLAAHYRAVGPPRGEAVIVIGAPEPTTPDDVEIGERLRAALPELGVRAAAAQVAAETGLPRSELYRRALALRGEKP
jgi:16S rRNA (cytidine1402-2'-O)-methyltransferase